MPDLFRIRGSGAPESLNKSRVKITDGETFSNPAASIDYHEELVALIMLSSIRWESMAYVKSGAMKGINHGNVSFACNEQIEAMNEMLAKVIGSDASILEPGYYSSLFR